jgi:hypothetical protein
MNIHALSAALALSLTASAATSQERTLEGAHQFLAPALGTGIGSLPGGIFRSEDNGDTTMITAYEGRECRGSLRYGAGGQRQAPFDWTRVVAVTRAETPSGRRYVLLLITGYVDPGGGRPSGIAMFIDQPEMLERVAVAADFIRQKCGGGGGF